MQLPPPDSPFGKPIQPALSSDLMRIMQRIPALLEAQVDGITGPVDLPPEQLGEVLQQALFLLMRYVPNIAGKLGVLYAAVAELEKRVADDGAAPA